MIVVIVALLLSSTFHVVVPVKGFSSGMGGSCDPGIGAIESNRTDNTHIQYNNNNDFPINDGTTNYNRTGIRTSLLDCGIVLLLNGVEVLPGDIMMNITVPVQEDVLWDVMIADTSNATIPHYKGIFVRVEKLTDDFQHLPMDNVTLKNVVSCEPMIGVIGVNHNSNVNKTRSTGSMYFNSTGPVTMDVSIVFMNTASTSYYAFDTFTFMVVDDDNIVIEEGNNDTITDAPVQLETTVPNIAPQVSPICGRFDERNRNYFTRGRDRNDDNNNNTYARNDTIYNSSPDEQNNNRNWTTRGDGPKYDKSYNRSCDDGSGVNQDRFDRNYGGDRDGRNGGGRNGGW